MARSAAPAASAVRRRSSSAGTSRWDAAAEAATEETIVEGAAAHLASEREGAGRRRAAIDRLHHRNAVATVSAPGPPALVMRNNELPVALPPLMTSLSDGEPSPPKKVFIAIVPPAPDVAGRRQDRARRGARAHVHQAGIGDAGYGLTEAIEIERSAARDRHCRIWAERVQRACPQRARVDIRRSAVAVGACERGGAREHIDSAVAADRGRKHVVGGRVIEVERTGASAKCDARRGERAGRSRRIARARADVECSNRAGVRRDHNRPR